MNETTATYSDCDICWQAFGYNPTTGARDFCPRCDGDKGYRVVRIYRDIDRRRVMAEGLSLREAQAWCRDPETSSSTASSAIARARTALHGPWFDGYVHEDK